MQGADLPVVYAQKMSTAQAVIRANALTRIGVLTEAVQFQNVLTVALRVTRIAKKACLQKLNRIHLQSLQKCTALKSCLTVLNRTRKKALFIIERA